MLFYLAYGSNLNLEQMAKRCPTAKPVGIGLLEDYRLIFRYYLTIENQKGGFVPFVLWEIDEESERMLDYYEGFPRFYRKEYVNVLVGEKLVCDGICNERRSEMLRSSKFDILHSCLEGISRCRTK